MDQTADYVIVGAGSSARRTERRVRDAVARQAHEVLVLPDILMAGRLQEPSAQNPLPHS